MYVIFVCMYVCMLFLYVCMYVCLYVYLHMCIYIYTATQFKHVEGGPDREAQEVG